MFIMKKSCRKISSLGFTLLEILIALFVFTILSVLLTQALRTVIEAQSATEEKANRLRTMQFALFLLQRDISQAFDRPIINAKGKEEQSFIGDARGFDFSHLGRADALGAFAQSAIERTAYVFDHETLSRQTYSVLDQAPSSQAHTRILLKNINKMRFQYLDQAGHFQKKWPPDQNQGDALPRAIQLDFDLMNWGELQQLFLIQAQSKKIEQANEPMHTS